jgi:hypothetical protein
METRFPVLSRPAPRPTKPPLQWVSGLSRKIKRSERTTQLKGGRDSVVGILSHYQLDGRGIVSRWGFFCIRTGQPWCQPSLLYNRYRASFPGVKQPGRSLNYPPHLLPRLKSEETCTSIVPLDPVASCRTKFTFLI